MRKRIASVLLLLSCLSFFVGCDINSMSTLSEFSRPYVGEYECGVLRYGGDDMTVGYKSIKLNLKYGGEFLFSYEGKGGSEGEWGGEYTVSPEGDQITFTAKAGARQSVRSFPIENGTILIDLNFSGKLLHAEFSFPK